MCEDLLGKWALNLMLINVSTRRFGRAVRLPEGDISAAKGTGVSKLAVSRRFVALSAERMAEWMAADLSGLDLLIIQIDGIHIEEDLTLLAAIGIDGDGGKHPLGVIEGATENAAVAQALLDNLIGRGLDPKVCRLFIIDGAKALSKAIRRTFGRHTPIQRCQVHKARNITERLAKPLHASVRRLLLDHSIHSAVLPLQVRLTAAEYVQTLTHPNASQLAHRRLREYRHKTKGPTPARPLVD